MKQSGPHRELAAHTATPLSNGTHWATDSACVCVCVLRRWLELLRCLCQRQLEVDAATAETVLRPSRTEAHRTATLSLDYVSEGDNHKLIENCRKCWPRKQNKTLFVLNCCCKDIKMSVSIVLKAFLWQVYALTTINSHQSVQCYERTQLGVGPLKSEKLFLFDSHIVLGDAEPRYIIPPDPHNQILMFKVSVVSLTMIRSGHLTKAIFWRLLPPTGRCWNYSLF